MADGEYTQLRRTEKPGKLTFMDYQTLPGQALETVESSQNIPPRLLIRQLAPPNFVSENSDPEK